ncbi:3-hydroxyacyl-ACP dehydratase FabZ [Neoehrlichia mikurensis]|uniref:3-hydroxyacyl-[acyl-carrier-protein] dehydratase FabZ n=1 Tax=Neoehrlichia mikurensis TaxID=89586 RepID=A0A9Q9C0Y5_9RICK|nr:3-hydroxyacyl-ACP dehydratase FabZ [Neoehrlichia mikurensis]QXK91626.1 3-hydroxyacyl-ACP dehydratase FabZ [Neoehrlichia mikurensis]QXK92837.1 3-hydroxyacyl-ACP dehydratase FabZ [Neoehrlichia mikurensis]QXK93317.1 3-hydroxyacyl-ACP dehydratase FabZ [Neoehrlichia mikurensis]UTO55740.1 3-hydroxyacyl-ACP dehydratase FabZ [Neoehrlichia mikurensis]UTO56657.1 3-hydroxyacyl-ACP dehydratase FabZ [Neoehrlichia mikurensis]
MNFDIKQIIKMLPHSYPFILIDRIIECNPSQYAIAIKNVTFNEPFFMGHFPSNPIMPGVLIIEAMAQTSMVCIVSSFNSHEVSKKSVYFLAIDSAKFRKVVIPGDAIIINANVIHQRKGTCRFKCNAYVDNQLVAEAYILAMISNTVSN